MDFMQLLQAAAPQGIWALLFVALFIFTISENKKREDKLIGTLDKYAASYERLAGDVAKIRVDVDELKSGNN